MVAPVLLPDLRGRAITLKRIPDGVEKTVGASPVGSWGSAWTTPQVVDRVAAHGDPSAPVLTLKQKLPR
jgi:hypothetical protein